MDFYLILETPRTPEGYRSLVSLKAFSGDRGTLLAEAEWMVTTRTRAGTKREGREILKLYAIGRERFESFSIQDISEELDRLLRGELNAFIEGLSDEDWKRRLANPIAGYPACLFTPELGGYLHKLRDSLRATSEGRLYPDSKETFEVPTIKRRSERNSFRLVAITATAAILVAGIAVAFHLHFSTNSSLALPKGTEEPEEVTQVTATAQTVSEKLNEEPQAPIEPTTLESREESQAIELRPKEEVWEDIRKVVATFKGRLDGDKTRGTDLDLILTRLAHFPEDPNMPLLKGLLKFCADAEIDKTYEGYIKQLEMLFQELSSK